MNILYCTFELSKGLRCLFRFGFRDRRIYHSSHKKKARYGLGDVQLHRHLAVDSNNLIYWKDTKAFADGCSSPK